VQLRRGGPALATLAAGLAVGLAVAVPVVASEPEWNLARIGAPTTARDVVVAVVDTGVDGSHPTLAGRVLPAIDLVGGAGGDPNGHGTHVAGTIAGADAGCGSIGVAPDARILPVRVLDAAGEGTAEAVADGIRAAADAGAAIINLSLGTDIVLRNVSGGSGLRAAIDHAWSKGAIPVLASGNDGVVGGLFGSGYGDAPAVVVTATDNQDRAASYATSIGSARWGIAAPGGDTSGERGRDVLSAFPGRRCALNAGTSMAAPHVSGALAALRARGLSPADAVARLLATARDLGARGPDDVYGHGLLDVRAAVGASAAPAPTVPPTTVAGAPGSGSSDERPATTAVSGGGAAGGASPTTVAVAPDAEAATGTTVPGVQGRSPTTTTRRSVEGSAAPVVVGGGSDGDDAPGGLVVVAVAALGTVAAGSAMAARRLGRR